jgi:putative NADPH-quinone reductase
MAKRITIIQGHPDEKERHFGHALAKAYEDGATAAGHQVRTIAVSELDFPLLRNQADWLTGKAPASILPAQEAVYWAEHVVIIYPLWMGDVPALLKGFLEQLLRPGFAFQYTETKGFPKKLLTGRSARIVVTMGMPALAYKWYFRAHSLKSLERNILGFAGFKPVESTVIGLVEGSAEARAGWLSEMVKLGEQAR